MKTRIHEWLNTKTGAILYGVQALHNGVWRHTSTDCKPNIFTSRAKAKRVCNSFRKAAASSLNLVKVQP